MKSALTALLAMCLCLGLPLKGADTGQSFEEVFINDPFLKEKFGKQFKKPYGKFSPPLRLSSYEIASITILYLGNTQITDEGLKDLAELKNLKTLNLSGCEQIKDAGLKGFAKLQNLTALHLTRTQITDSGLEELAKLQKLKFLVLSDTQITDEGLKEVAKLQKLEVLSLSGTQISDIAIKELARLKSLWHLDLSGTKITDAGLKKVVKLRKLEALDLSETQITDEGLKDLAELKNLKTLNLSGCEQIKDAGLKGFTKLQNLTALHLTRTQITDSGLKELAKLQKLEVLSLSGTQISGADVVELRKAMPYCEIFFSSKEVITNPNTKLSTSPSALTDEIARIRAQYSSGMKSNIDRASSAEFVSYAQYVVSVYRRTWEPLIPKTLARSRAAVVSVTIDRTGNVLSARVVRKTGDAALDRSVQSALDRVRSIGKPFPSGSLDSKRTFTLDFTPRLRN